MKTLVAEDNPVFQKMLRTMLTQWGYEVAVAQDGAEAWACLQAEGGPRLAILDWVMPVMDGLEVCRRVRAEVRDRYVYILLLTARADVVLGMEAGADDYLTKPFNVPELRVRLRAGRRVLDLQQELLRAQDALQEQATRDGLTGLWNRTNIFEILQRELARAIRNTTPLAVLMADLDHFKLVNDTYGHPAGDVVLRETARRMHSAVRCYDAIGRYGGEEFLIVLPSCDLTGGLSQAERLRGAIAAESFRFTDAAIPVTCSLGVSCTETPENSRTDLLIREADSALYRAKRKGRNRVETSAPQPAIVHP